MELSKIAENFTTPATKAGKKMVEVVKNAAADESVFKKIGTGIADKVKNFGKKQCETFTKKTSMGLELANGIGDILNGVKNGTIDKESAIEWGKSIFNQ